MKYATLKIMHDTLTEAVKAAEKAQLEAWQRFDNRAFVILDLTTDEAMRHPETAAFYEEYDHLRRIAWELNEALSDFQDRDWR